MAETRLPVYGSDDRLRALMVASLWNVLLGILVIVVPLGADTAEAGVFWNNIVSGVLIALLAAYNAYATWSEHRRPSRLAAAANALLGLWVLASPAVYLPEGVVTAANVVLGLVIAILATFNAWTAGTAGRKARPLARTGF